MSVNKWWRGQRWQRRGLSQSHKRKLTRQCLGAPYPIPMMSDRDFHLSLTALFRQCERQPKPDMVLVTDKLAVEMGLI